MTPGRVFALFCLMAGSAVVALHAQPAGREAPALTTLLARAAAYVEEFRQQLSGIVAEETYTQRQIPGTSRELRSDLLLVRSNAFPRTGSSADSKCTRVNGSRNR